MSPDLLASDLRAWASVAWQQGASESAKLLQTAADAVESRLLDPGLAAEVLAYSCQLDLKGKLTLSEVLLCAGEALTPRLTDVLASEAPDKAGRPRSVIWDVVERPAKASEGAVWE